MLNVNKKAFTLVELIVVITILSILGIIAFISLQWYTKIARDTSRISDISKIKTIEDLVINTKEDNSKMNDNYDNILIERKFKNNIKIDKDKMNSIKKELSLTNITTDIPEDYEDIKSEFKSEFENQEIEIKEGRNKFNSILESLLSDGLLD